jgi:hypothetical protein
MGFILNARRDLADRDRRRQIFEKKRDYFCAAGRRRAPFLSNLSTRLHVGNVAIRSGISSYVIQSADDFSNSISLSGPDVSQYAEAAVLKGPK